MIVLKIGENDPLHQIMLHSHTSRRQKCMTLVELLFWKHAEKSLSLEENYCSQNSITSLKWSSLVPYLCSILKAWTRLDRLLTFIAFKHTLDCFDWSEIWSESRFLPQGATHQFTAMNRSKDAYLLVGDIAAHSC